MNLSDYTAWILEFFAPLSREEFDRIIGCLTCAGNDDRGVTFKVRIWDDDWLILSGESLE